MGAPSALDLKLIAPNKHFTSSYLTALRGPLADGVVRGLAHVTGGGVPGNLPRVLPNGIGASLDRAGWEVPAVYQTMQAAGGVAQEEMDRVFNMGVGMIVAVDSSDVSVILDAAAACGVEGWTIGSTVEGEGVTGRRDEFLQTLFRPLCSIKVYTGICVTQSVRHGPLPHMGFERCDLSKFLDPG